MDRRTSPTRFLAASDHLLLDVKRVYLAVEEELGQRHSEVPRAAPDVRDDVVRLHRDHG